VDDSRLAKFPSFSWPKFNQICSNSLFVPARCDVSQSFCLTEVLNHRGRFWHICLN
jgi:hypothetical protein